MIRKLFLDHPGEVNESYARHFCTAAGVGLTMIAGGVAALVHAVVPGLCQTAGSRTIRRLDARLGGGRARMRDANAEMKSAEWVI